MEFLCRWGQKGFKIGDGNFIVVVTVDEGQIYNRVGRRKYKEVAVRQKFRLYTHVYCKRDFFSNKRQAVDEFPRAPSMVWIWVAWLAQDM